MSTVINTILLADDDTLTNFINKLVIKDKEIAENITTLNNGEDLLNFLKNTSNKKPDAILIDINMPVMDGWEFLDIIENKKIIDVNKCKIIILTASQNPEDREKASKYKSVSGYLHKPLDYDVLIEILNS